MREQPLHERVPGREEVDGLVLDRLLAIEGADHRRSCRHTREAVDDRLVSELNPVGSWAAHLLDLKAETLGGVGDDALDECVEVRRNAREDSRTKFRAIRIAMELVIGALFNP